MDSSQTVLCPLSRFDFHLQAKLEKFETKMAARNAGRSISMILRKKAVVSNSNSSPKTVGVTVVVVVAVEN